MDDQQKQRILDLPKVAAGAVASPSAALLTSRFGVAGTMIGLALSAMIVTVVADTLKVYFARVPGAVTSIPGGFKKKSRWGRFLVRLGLPFSKLASLAPARRRYILIRSLIGGVIAFLIGLVVVTGLELGVGKNLSCWVWDDDCAAAQSSADESDASDTSTLPSILGGGRHVSSSAPQIAPSAPQQQPAPPPPATPAPQGSSGKPWQPPVSEQPSTPPSQQQSPSGDQQQQSGYQQTPTSSPETQQQSPPSESGGQQPEGPPNESPTPPSSP